MSCLPLPCPRRAITCQRGTFLAMPQCLQGLKHSLMELACIHRCSLMELASNHRCSSAALAHYALHISADLPARASHCERCSCVSL